MNDPIPERHQDIWAKGYRAYHLHNFLLQVVLE